MNILIFRIFRFFCSLQFCQLGYLILVSGFLRIEVLMDQNAFSVNFRWSINALESIRTFGYIEICFFKYLGIFVRYNLSKGDFLFWWAVSPEFGFYWIFRKFDFFVFLF